MPLLICDCGASQVIGKSKGLALYCEVCGSKLVERKGEQDEPPEDPKGSSTSPQLRA